MYMIKIDIKKPMRKYLNDVPCVVPFVFPGSDTLYMRVNINKMVTDQILNMGNLDEKIIVVRLFDGYLETFHKSTLVVPMKVEVKAEYMYSEDDVEEEGMSCESQH